jgi:hypothetical protein
MTWIKNCKKDNKVDTCPICSKIIQNVTLSDPFTLTKIEIIPKKPKLKPKPNIIFQPPTTTIKTTNYISSTIFISTWCIFHNTTK